MAIRNTWRQKRRSLLTSAAIALGVWMAILFTSVGNFSYMQMIDNSTMLGFGHVSILAKDYITHPSTKKTVDINQQTLSLIKNLPDTIKVEPRIIGQGIAMTASNSAPVQFVGNDLNQKNLDQHVIVKSITQGQIFPEGTNQCLIGAGLAKKLNLSVGKKLVVQTTDVNGDVNSGLLRVSGIFKTNAPEIDQFFLLTSLKALKDILHYSDDQFSILSIAIEDGRKSNTFRKQLVDALQNAGFSWSEKQALTWDESQPELAGFIAIDRGSSQVFLLFIIILIGFGTLNTMLNAVMERQREFGIMLALGTSRGQLTQIVIFETLILSIVGIAMGCILVLPMHFYLNTSGIDVSSLIGEATSAGGSVYDPILRSRIFLTDLAIIVPGITAWSMFASIYPALKASRLPPIEAMRNYR